MNESDTARLVREEAEHAELHKDEDYEIGPETKVTRPGRARGVVFSVRLSAEEVEAVEAAAADADIPPSTLVRGLVVRGLAERAEETPAALAQRIAGEAERLRELVET